MKYFTIIFLSITVNILAQETENIIINNIDIFSKKDTESKKELLEIIDNTYKYFDRKKCYKYNTATYNKEITGEKLEEENGFFIGNNYFGLKFNIFYKWSGFENIDPVAFFSFRKRSYFYFENKNTLHKFKKSIKTLEVRRINNIYILFKNDWNDNIVIEVDPDKNIIKRIKNNVSEYDFFEINDNVIFKRNSIVYERDIDIYFFENNNSIVQEVSGYEIYYVKKNDLYTYKHIDITPSSEPVDGLKKRTEIQRISFITNKRIE